jgi:hypothetical protein
MTDDRLKTMAEFPTAFEWVRSPSSAGVDSGPRRTHDFDGLQLGATPSVDELLAVIDRLDADNEAQRLRLMQVFDQLEEAVTEQVSTERRADQSAAALAQARAELAALRNTKLLRAAQPLRSLYGRLLRRRRG